MDPRQPPQHPFSRNTASPYGRTPFPPTSNPGAFPSSHPPPSAPAYAEHQRRPSDPPYYTQPRTYGQEGPVSGSGHARHQSASSIGTSIPIGTPVNRNMPPPSSPQQQQAPQQPPHHAYGPPPPRPPPVVAVGPPTTFPSGRELPTLPPLGRPASNGSSMSISSMLGGPPQASREHPPSQYASPIVTTAPPTSMFGPTHASPRMSTATSDYPPTYRRPQTPEHQRNYESRDNNRANSAGSPSGMGQYPTPEGRRYGTPQQGYGQRVAAVEERREPMRVPNPNAMPPRPSSQPTNFNPPPPRVAESARPPLHSEPLFGRRMEGAPRAPESSSRPEPGYGRPPFEERHEPYPYAQRERLEREAAMQRDADNAALMRIQQRERESRARAEHESNLYAQQIAERNSQNAYNRPPEPREQTPAWMRPGYEPPDRRYEPPSGDRPPQQQPATSSYEYPATTTGPQFGRVATYHPSMPHAEHRYGQAPPPPPPQQQQQQQQQQQPPPSSMAPQQHGSQPTSHYEREALERQRLSQQQEEQRLRQQQQHQQQHQQQSLDRQQQQQAMYGNHPNQQYQQHESPQRRPAVEESQPMQQSRSFLGVQEINRKGRASPLPQAVQGAQGPLNVAGGEPSIKNEFGRMFSGIGMGLGAMSVPSPVSASAQGIPFSNSGQLRREDLDNLQDSPIENGHRLPRSASRQGGGRRRKLKEEDGRDDESSTGRRTPSGNGRGGPKRTKTGHHHAPHHHHHHRPDENTSSPSQSNLTPFKSAKGLSIPSPPGPEPRSAPNLHHHHVPRHHHHHHHVTTPKTSAPVNIVIPLVKPRIGSQQVLDEVAKLPRRHLGSEYYRSDLRPAGSTVHPKLTTKKAKAAGGFVSTPRPLPRFEGRENCLYTVKIPPIYLAHDSREEITKRKAVWGTDVYTDDSDIVAACIHQGWFRGAWADDIPVELLGLEIEVESNGEVQKPFSINDTMTRPPPTGPIEVPEGLECHVTIVIAPALKEYGSLIRFGLKSREWGFKRDGYRSVHDGMSFMIHSIKWVSVVDGQEGRTRASRSKIFAEQLNHRELEEEGAWEDMLRNGNGSSSKSNGSVQESFERGGSRYGDIQDTRSWLTGINKPSPKGKEKELVPTPTPPPARILGPLPPPIPSPLSSPIVAPEPLDEEEVTPNMAALLARSLEAQRVPERSIKQDREQRMVTPTPQQESEIERVTERMIENANMMEAVQSAPVPVTAHAMDPIATLAELAVAHSEVATAPVSVAAQVLETKIKSEKVNEKSHVEAKTTELGKTPSIFG